MAKHRFLRDMTASRTARTAVIGGVVLLELSG